MGNMPDSRKYSLRPQARSLGDSTLAGAFRAFMSPADLQSEGISQGDYVSIQSEATGIRGIAIAWRATDNIGSGFKSQGAPVVRVSEFLRGHYGFELKDKFFITKWTENLQLANTVTVASVSIGGDVRKTPAFAHEDYWIRTALTCLESIAVGGTFEVTPHTNGKPSQKRRYLIEKVEPSGRDTTISIPYVFPPDGKLIISSSTSYASGNTRNTLEIDFSGIIGEATSLERLQVDLNVHPHYPIILLGPTETGKSTALKRIKDSPWGKVVTIDSSVVDSSKAKLQIPQWFNDAAANQPALVVIDEIDELIPKDLALPPWASVLLDQIEKSSQCEIRVVAAARRMADVHEKIRRIFEPRINFTLPTAANRLEIVQQFVKSYNIDGSILQRVVDQSHAFTAKNLSSLLISAVRESRWRNRKAAEHSRITETKSVLRESTSTSTSQSHDDQPVVEWEDFEAAFKLVQPTVMNEVYIDIPNVSWNDVGGYDQLKKDLQLVSSMTTEQSQHFQKAGSRPHRGVLMYGPPGCSKTLIAQAFASESRFNFIGVKGPELLSKYVGDTEANIREIFEKAKAAAPSVIFFDEFDSLAKRNTGHDSLSPVTALLTEMDGFETLSGVLVLAATNRPWEIDNALLRPGRFGKICYVGPPELEAREQIFKIKTQHRPLDESVDLRALALETEHHSGAEITQICEQAGMNAAQAWSEDIENEKQFITDAHFRTALAETKPGITKDMLLQFDNWRLN